MCSSGCSQHIQTVINFLPCELQHVVSYCAHGCNDSFAKGLDVWNRCSVDFVFYLHNSLHNLRISYIILRCCFLLVEPFDSRLYFLRTNVTDFVSANLITHCAFLASEITVAIDQLLCLCYEYVSSQRYSVLLYCSIVLLYSKAVFRRRSVHSVQRSIDSSSNNGWIREVFLIITIMSLSVLSHRKINDVTFCF